MFGKKNPPTQGGEFHRNQLNQMTASVLSASEVDFDTSTKLTQALVATFLFGMIYAYGKLHKLTPPEVRAHAIRVFQDTLHYSDLAAAEGVDSCIDASRLGRHETMNAILHRGIDGHAAYLDNNTARTTENLKGILEHFAQ